nr:SGNH/GDSL hydrolase family protein [uncultured Anaerocolumna sp.]
MEKDISKIDKNLKVSSSFDENDILFFDVRNDPFKIYGLYNYKKETVFKRMPDDIAKAASEGVGILNYNTTGGRVRLKTTSRYIAIKAKMPSVTVLPHMTLAGTSGFDLYINNDGKSTYYKTFMPPVGMEDGYESIIYFNDNRERDLTINFPLYNDVSDLYIGFQETAILKKGDSYKYKNPVLYYGSSITQGGCASRPGNSYQAIISRMLDCDYINFGFSGNAKGEDEIVDYMSELNMSVFVCDYDHNAPSVEHLIHTHGSIYKRFREKNPELPIIFISKPDFNPYEFCDIQRRNVIYSTYINAINEGDKNVYYIDGQSLFKDDGRDSCTVDGCHPNDLGFMRMAETIGYIIKKVIK